jgi:hypothetical protein
MNKLLRMILFENAPSVAQKILSTQPSNLLAYYPLSELSGTTIYPANQHTGNLCVNSGLELWRTSPNIPTGWSYQLANGGAITPETTSVHGGASAAKITAGTAQAYNTKLILICGGAGKSIDALTPGTAYTLSFWSHGDGTTNPIYSIYDNTHSASIKADTGTGYTSATIYSQTTWSFVVPAGCLSLSITFYAGAVNGSSYFDDISLLAPAADNPMRGVLSGTGTTLGVAGVCGKPSFLFNGSGYVTLPVSLANALQGAGGVGICNTGSVLTYQRFSEADVWTQPDDRAYDKHLSYIGAVDGDGSTEDQSFSYKCGGESFLNNPVWTSTQRWPGYGANPNLAAKVGNNWFSLIYAWNIAENRLTSYLNGLLDNAMSIDPTVAAWTYPVFQVQLAAKAGVDRQIGGMQHAAFWDVELSASEALTVGQ